MRLKTLTLLIFVFAFRIYAQPKPNELKLMTASGNPMQYYVSLPKNWAPDKQWPVVIILEAAEKLYKENAERFIAARGDMPFVIIAPIHVANGNQGRRDPKLFPYTTETWDYIDKVGDCKFNEDGFKQIMIDAGKLFRAESKFFITGFEAGAHPLWSLVFNHPEYLKAAAPVASNYRARCVEESAISKDNSRTKLPVNSFAGENDSGFGPKGTYYGQWLAAKDLAVKNGYTQFSETIVSHKDHVPMPEEVLKYFYSLLKN
jgi:poly(3-hydroxybutyrate) depolymerase